MTNNHLIREGGCACGAVRFKTQGDPLRTGMCHCLTCRKAHGSAFNPYAVFRVEQVSVEGELTSWQSSPDYRRDFCPRCGSPVIGGDSREAEVSMGSFDEPGLFEPQYELWVKRREPWLAPLDVPQFVEDRSQTS